MQATGVVDRQARPFVRAPDLLTAVRIPLGVAFVLFDGGAVRLGILVAAAFSDFVDGIWARRIGGSRLGVFLDPACDKLFFVAAFLVVFRSGALMFVELIGVLLRDILAVLALLGTWMFRRPTALPARAGGKAVTVCQMLALVAFVAQSDLVRPLAWATAAISVYAIADYGRAAWHR